MSTGDLVSGATATEESHTTLGHYTDTEWDIVSGVGYTALAVAAGRAMETARPDALISDPQAKYFVRAAQVEGSPIALPTEWPPETEEMASIAGVDQEDLDTLWQTTTSYMGVRTRFFDQYFQAACDEGEIRQVVLLAAGLDSRAYRLDWPVGTHVFEIDHPNVLEFKDRVLTEQGAAPGCHRHAVGVDLREDWPAALLSAGFDPDLPTAWLAEGLIFYLEDDAKQSLFQRVQELSALGSRWAIESMSDPGRAMAVMSDDQAVERLSSAFGTDPTGLWPADQRWEPHGWLVQQGWAVSTASAGTVAARYGRSTQGPIPVGDNHHRGMLVSALFEQSVAVEQPISDTADA